MYNQYYTKQIGLQYGTEDEIRAYILQPNTQIMALDREKPIFYIKSADNLGRSVLTKYKYEEIVDKPIEPNVNADYLTKDDVKEFVSKADLLELKTLLENEIKGLKNAQSSE